MIPSARCEQDNYSDDVSESDVERCSVSSQLDVIEVIGIAPDTPAETRIQQLSTLEEPMLSSDDYSDQDIPDSSGSDLENSPSL
ncbi:hypothetical protein OUZ56_005712 [Daphnia magna]|uniref:Uncharacterized protein n=1 Tax=Daphnia magna TaxID=35525 RepID=A0ABQ9YTJ7_9CRUS|nr:hypothetical protein OUZ56_005712 [Daphnia magna]